MSRTYYTVVFSNGDSISSWINGSAEDIQNLFPIGEFCNIGTGPNDNYQQVKSVVTSYPENSPPHSQARADQHRKEVRRMKIKIEGSVNEITDFVMGVRSRLFKKTVDEDMKSISEAGRRCPPEPARSPEPPGYRCPPGEKGTPGYL